MAWLTVIEVIAGLVALVALLNAVIATGGGKEEQPHRKDFGLPADRRRARPNDRPRGAARSEMGRLVRGDRPPGRLPSNR
jgi:hypothetical protein